MNYRILPSASIIHDLVMQGKEKEKESLKSVDPTPINKRLIEC